MKGLFELLRDFEGVVAPEITRLAEIPWYPPHVLQEKIGRLLLRVPEFSAADFHLLISGETQNLSIYIIKEMDVLIFTPFQEVFQNLIYRECSPRVLLAYDQYILAVEKSEALCERLALPRVVLLNLSVKDVFPIPRLALGVAYIASYLRKKQAADVRIVDMQAGLTVEKLIDELRFLRPEVIGISIDFGQLNVAKEILRNIFADAIIMSADPLVIAGNSIAAFAYEQLHGIFPKLLVCSNEGEEAMLRAVQYRKGDCRLDEVPGISYRDGKQTRVTPLRDVAMDDLTLPAMDTVEAIVQHNGALTMEISRGCFHSACSFCPRTNKVTRWKGMSATEVLRQLQYYNQIFEHFQIQKRIFLADEEFIGWQKDGREAERIIAFNQGLLERQYRIRYESNTRIDQIYNPHRDREWHLRRIEMLDWCKQGGLERLLVGVESGSDRILKRFNKKIQVQDSVLALRILTALGMGLRITFITFDPLMNYHELVENILFLERRDLFMKEVNLTEMGVEALYDGVHNPVFVQKYSRNQPLYENIAYMVSSLEILIGSDYCSMVEPDLFITRKPDINMARHKVAYRDRMIGEIALHCQKWVDRNFALDYCLKGLYKTAASAERSVIVSYRVYYRKMSFLLLKVLAWVYDYTGMLSLADNQHELGDLMPILEELKIGRTELQVYREQAVLMILNLFHTRMVQAVQGLESAAERGEVGRGSNLTEVILQWKEQTDWVLINA